MNFSVSSSWPQHSLKSLRIKFFLCHMVRISSLVSEPSTISVIVRILLVMILLKSWWVISVKASTSTFKLILTSSSPMIDELSTSTSPLVHKITTTSSHSKRYSSSTPSTTTLSSSSFSLNFQYISDVFSLFLEKLSYQTRYILVDLLKRFPLVLVTLPMYEELMRPFIIVESVLDDLLNHSFLVNFHHFQNKSCNKLKTKWNNNSS